MRHEQERTVAGVRGILNPPPGPPEFRLSRYKPDAELAPMIEHYWMVSWDLQDNRTHSQDTLPHPNVHVVFERDDSRAYGVVRGKFSRLLEGKGQVFGVRFAPGMFRLCLGYSVSKLTDETRPATDMFGEGARTFEQLVRRHTPETDLVMAADGFLRSRVPKPDAKASLAKELVSEIMTEADLLTVEDVARRSGMSKRTLERLFSEYVGVGPKWVIRRYRLQEAIEKLRCAESINYAELAFALGYFDQAHLINDFKSVVGCTPRGFQKLVAAGAY